MISSTDEQNVDIEKRNMFMEFRIKGTDASNMLSVSIEEASDETISRFDGDNLTMSVSVDSGCFHVTDYPIYGRAVRQLVVFTEALEKCYKTLSGCAEFRSDEWDEDGLSFTLTMKPSGYAQIYGTITGVLPRDNSMSFQLKTDQTFLLETLNQLRAILRLFGKKGV